MADDPGGRPRLNPAILVLGALLLGGLLFWAFLCTVPADTRVGENPLHDPEQIEGEAR